MPCDGPNEAQSHARADQAYEEIIQRYDLTVYERGFCADDMLVDQKRLREALRALFWTAACNSF